MGGYFCRSYCESNELEKCFSEEEIKQATFQLGADKAPGPDGFPILFFQNSRMLLRTTW